MFQGAWASTTAYASGAIVTYNGASYVSLAANTNVTPGSNASDWALLDAPGATGPQGPVGATGPKGVTGATGAAGPAGPAGATGAKGAQGVAGPAGSAGPAGPTGAPGATGATGATGPAGPVGATGLRGLQGVAGLTGQVGATGPMGPAGPSGAQGPAGPAGPAGNDGAGFAFLGAWSATTNYTVNNVATENGSAYVALTTNVGVDPAADVANTTGNWALFAAAGAQGAIGPSGAMGVAGSTGPAGPAGPAGIGGALGPAGSQGPTGPQGSTGAQGIAGPTGPQGPPGAPGANGNGVPNCTAPNTYVILFQGALVCQPRFNANGDGTLTDNQTGLMWQLQTSSCQGEVTCYSSTYTWSIGDNNPDGTLYTNFLAALNLDTSSDGISTCFANHCNWRIPNISDLQTIIETSATGCTSGSACIDPAFGLTSTSCGWSASTVAGSTAYAWDVVFGTGAINNLDSKTAGCTARAVRSGR